MGHPFVATTAPPLWTDARRCQADRRVARYRGPGEPSATADRI